MSLTRRFESLCDKLSAALNSHGAVLTLLAITSVYLFTQSTAADPDLFARLAVGRLVHELGQMPLQDLFAFTPKKELWVDHEWLSGVFFFALHQIGGDRALFIFKCLCALLTFSFLLQARRLYATVKQQTMAWTLLCGLECIYLWTSTVRAQVFSYLFLALLLKQLLEFTRSGRLSHLLWLPALFALWCNLHGGFVLGIILIAVFLCTSKCGPHWKLGGVLLTCSAATLINPYPGLSLWQFLSEALSMPRPTITEWKPVHPLAQQAQIINLVSLILLAGLSLSGKVKHPYAPILLLGTASLAYLGERFAALYMFSAIVFGADYFHAVTCFFCSRFRSLSRVITRSFSFAICLIGLICIVQATLFFAHFSSFLLDRSFYPVAALAWLKESKAEGRLLVDFNLGSYAIWTLYPQFKVSLDGRYEELYPDSTLLAVDAALNPQNAQHTSELLRLNPSHILLSRNADPAAFAPDWKVIFKDESYSILARALPEAL